MDGTEKGIYMRRMLVLLLGVILLLGSFPVTGLAFVDDDLFAQATSSLMSNEGRISISVSLDGMTKQSELMNASEVSGKITVSNHSGGSISATVMVAAYHNDRMLTYQTLHSGAVLTGVMPFSFTLDKLNQADCIKAFLIPSDILKPYCLSAKDGLDRAQAIIFKFDDVRPSILDQTLQFDKALSYLADQGIPATAGILGKWLEEAEKNPADYHTQMELIQNWVLQGHQLWIHGYDHAQGEFAAMGEVSASSYDKQTEIIGTTYGLMESVLRYSATCFAPSYNQNNEDTISVLNQEFPQINTVMFVNDPNGRLEAMNLTNSCTMENGTGVASYEAFLNHYAMVKDQPYLVLQAHPGYWDENSLDALKKIAAYLKEQNCVFMTPEQYRLFSLSQK